MPAEQYKQVGIFYCLTHLGTRNEDDPTDHCGWARYLPDEPTRCRFVPLTYKPPPPPRRDTGSVLWAMFNHCTEAEVAEMLKAVRYYDRLQKMGAVEPPFSGEAARNLIAWALTMHGESFPRSCLDGSMVHDFKGGTHCPKCGLPGVVMGATDG